MKQIKNILKFLILKYLPLWSITFYIAVWNEYIESNIYKMRKQLLGKENAKQLFITTDTHTGFIDIFKNKVKRNKKLMLKIIFIPFLIKPCKELKHGYQIINANDLWRS